MDVEVDAEVGPVESLSAIGRLYCQDAGALIRGDTSLAAVYGPDPVQMAEVGLTPLWTARNQAEAAGREGRGARAKVGLPSLGSV